MESSYVYVKHMLINFCFSLFICVCLVFFFWGGVSLIYRNGNPLQYSYLENSGGAWQATVYGVAKSRTRLSAHAQSVVQW